jgi:hypothetical protein
LGNGEDGYDHCAHGSVDDRSRSKYPEVWVVENREWLRFVAAGLNSFAIGLTVEEMNGNG